MVEPSGEESGEALMPFWFEMTRVRPVPEILEIEVWVTAFIAGPSEVTAIG